MTLDDLEVKLTNVYKEINEIKTSDIISKSRLTLKFNEIEESIRNVLVAIKIVKGY